jgi:hypothetical protein
VRSRQPLETVPEAAIAGLRQSSLLDGAHRCAAGSGFRPPWGSTTVAEANINCHSVPLRDFLPGVRPELLVEAAIDVSRPSVSVLIGGRVLSMN